ncbi:MAG: VanZ family protein [Candidatus Moranbacteria bacterium]|nr:VanZ family protein [Candidatus Moranbacteria bacterium]
MGSDKLEKILPWLAVLVWLAVIFGLSAMEGHDIRPFNLFYFIERKAFHIIEYFILNFLLYWAFSRNISQKRALLFSSILAVLYASSDEWHQTFVFGRTGTPRDVAIDLIGIVLAAILILKFNQWKKK